MLKITEFLGVVARYTRHIIILNIKVARAWSLSHLANDSSVCHRMLSGKGMCSTLNIVSLFFLLLVSTISVSEEDVLKCIMPNGQEPEVSEPLEDGEWLSVCPELRCRGEGNTILNVMTDLIPDGVVGEIACAAEEWRD